MSRARLANENAALARGCKHDKRQRVEVPDALFIGGKWTRPESETAVTVVSPSTEQPIGRVPLAGTADIDVAVSAAREAFDEGPWPRLPLEERLHLLTRLGD